MPRTQNNEDAGSDSIASPGTSNEVCRLTTKPVLAWFGIKTSVGSWRPTTYMQNVKDSSENNWARPWELRATRPNAAPRTSAPRHSIPRAPPRSRDVTTRRDVLGVGRQRGNDWKLSK
ncbi:hypothetical protein EVAR_78299_1 [Eumeta japonica]|uniref:Uncharacterized protein n=1 Tax=Eumeta variegata TaxID=151549 RepID=A0A4C1T451_EUMVA|nr:hypothetical protein EVAR_78299_1 [Eumeta japonica]